MGVFKWLRERSSTNLREGCADPIDQPDIPNSNRLSEPVGTIRTKEYHVALAEFQARRSSGTRNDFQTPNRKPKKPSACHSLPVPCTTCTSDVGDTSYYEKKSPRKKKNKSRKKQNHQDELPSIQFIYSNQVFMPGNVFSDSSCTEVERARVSLPEGQRHKRIRRRSLYSARSPDNSFLVNQRQIDFNADDQSRSPLFFKNNNLPFDIASFLDASRSPKNIPEERASELERDRELSDRKDESGTMDAVMKELNNFDLWADEQLQNDSICSGRSDKVDYSIGLQLVSSSEVDVSIDRDKRWNFGHWGIIPVQVKRLNGTTFENIKKKQNIEVEILRQCRHPNIVLLMGLYYDNSSVMHLICERCVDTLYGILHDQGQIVSAQSAVRYAADVASALAFLHMRGYVHTALSSRGVLVTRHDAAKLADLAPCARVPHRGHRDRSRRERLGGMYAPEPHYINIGEWATEEQQQQDCQPLISTRSSEVLGPDAVSKPYAEYERSPDYRWHAPEMFAPDEAGRVHPCGRTDVYALALVLWECCHAQIPWRNLSYEQLQSQYTLWRTGVRLPRRGVYPGALLDLLQAGLRVERTRRPDMRAFADRLHAVKGQLDSIEYIIVPARISRMSMFSTDNWDSYSHTDSDGVAVPNAKKPPLCKTNDTQRSISPSPSVKDIQEENVYETIRSTREDSPYPFQSKPSPSDEEFAYNPVYNKLREKEAFSSNCSTPKKRSAIDVPRLDLHNDDNDFEVGMSPLNMSQDSIPHSPIYAKPYHPSPLMNRGPVKQVTLVDVCNDDVADNGKETSQCRDDTPFDSLENVVNKDTVKNTGNHDANNVDSTTNNLDQEQIRLGQADWSQEETASAKLSKSFTPKSYRSLQINVPELRKISEMNTLPESENKPTYKFNIKNYTLPSTPIARRNKLRRNAWLSGDTILSNGSITEEVEDSKTEESAVNAKCVEVKEAVINEKLVVSAEATPKDRQRQFFEEHIENPLKSVDSESVKSLPANIRLDSKPSQSSTDKQNDMQMTETQKGIEKLRKNFEKDPSATPEDNDQNVVSSSGRDTCDFKRKKIQYVEPTSTEYFSTETKISDVAEPMEDHYRSRSLSWSYKSSETATQPSPEEEVFAAINVKPLVAKHEKMIYEANKKSPRPIPVCENTRSNPPAVKPASHAIDTLQKALTTGQRSLSRQNKHYRSLSPLWCRKDIMSQKFNSARDAIAKSLNLPQELDTKKTLNSVKSSSTREDSAKSVEHEPKVHQSTSTTSIETFIKGLIKAELQQILTEAETNTTTSNDESEDLIKKGAENVLGKLKKPPDSNCNGCTQSSHESVNAISTVKINGNNKPLLQITFSKSGEKSLNVDSCVNLHIYDSDKSGTGSRPKEDVEESQLEDKNSSLRRCQTFSALQEAQSTEDLYIDDEISQMNESFGNKIKLIPLHGSLHEILCEKQDDCCLVKVKEENGCDTIYFRCDDSQLDSKDAIDGICLHDKIKDKILFKQSISVEGRIEYRADKINKSNKELRKRARSEIYVKCINPLKISSKSSPCLCTTNKAQEFTKRNLQDNLFKKKSDDDVEVNLDSLASLNDWSSDESLKTLSENDEFEKLERKIEEDINYSNRFSYSGLAKISEENLSSEEVAGETEKNKA